jgi:hypothetical protein
LSVLQLLFWEILKFSSTFYCLSQLNRATFKRSNAPAHSGRDVTTSARLGAPTRPAYFRPYGDAVGPGCVLAPSPTPGQVAPRLRAGQVAVPWQLRRTAVTSRARPARVACAAAVRPVGPSEAPQPPASATHPLLPRICLGVAQSRPAAPAVTTGRRPKLAGALHLPPPLLESKHHTSLHPHPLDPPVHAHWPTDPPTRRHCGHRGRPPPSSPPAITGTVSGQADPANRPRVSQNPTLAAHMPESGPPSPPVGLAPPRGTSLQGLPSF